MRTNSKKRNDNTAVLYSAALQDHFLRKNNYTLSDKVTSKGQQKTSILPNIYQNKHATNLMIKQEQQIKALQHKQKNSILPYQSETLKKLKEVKSDNEKITNYKKKLTLAQKLGIVEAPPLPLTAKQWDQIEEKSKKRNDSQNICSICLENFKIQPQVILSCSHVFHMKCLNSYEKHNKVRCCPICRKKDYDKKVIDEAIKVFTMKSIIRIQRVFRGSRDRIRVYGQIVDSGYTAKSKLFNRRLIGFKMWRLSNKIRERTKKSQLYYEEMFEKIAKKHQAEKESILDEIVDVQRKRIIQEGAVEKYLSKFGISVNKKSEQKIVDWEQVKEKGVNRPDQQCAICLTNLWSKEVYLLSCTHLFHVNCVQGFERYALPGHQNKCPCCRSSYEKKLLKVKK